MAIKAPPAEPKFDPSKLVEATGYDSLRTVARRLGIDPALLCRPLSANQADRYATRLGMHPGEVWGVAWWRPQYTPVKGS
jgi:hypothetical protein